VIEPTDEMREVAYALLPTTARGHVDVALATVLALAERDLRVPDAYVHVECGTVTEWNAEMVKTYGPIGEQGCDCENAWSLNWRPLYAGLTEPGGMT
jgi:hypothetical protein